MTREAPEALDAEARQKLREVFGQPKDERTWFDIEAESASEDVGEDAWSLGWAHAVAAYADQVLAAVDALDAADETELAFSALTDLAARYRETLRLVAETGGRCAATDGDIGRCILTPGHQVEWHKDHWGYEWRNDTDPGAAPSPWADCPAERSLWAEIREQVKR